jgi:hypothetical protein
MDNVWPFLGIFVFGPALQVIAPYLRMAFEKIAETGKIKPWPLPLDWRYLAMFLLPPLEYGVAFAITPGLPAVVAKWGIIEAIAFAYAGSHLGKEVVMAGAAVVKMTRKAFR